MKEKQIVCEITVPLTKVAGLRDDDFIVVLNIAYFIGKVEFK